MREQIRDNILSIQEQIAAAALRSGRCPEDITLIGVTKNFDVAAIQTALDNGIEQIGENRVQELLDKYERVSPKAWHLIGHLQTNKVKYIIDKVDLIHSVDSLHLLEEIEAQAKKRDITANILVQVNISGEDTKFGVSKERVEELLCGAANCTHVKIRGLMTIGAHLDNRTTIRLQFDDMTRLYLDIAAKKYDNVSMECLSMGMSGDFVQAIEAGANMVRIGSLIFGTRNI